MDITINSPDVHPLCDSTAPLMGRCCLVFLKNQPAAVPLDALFVQGKFVHWLDPVMTFVIDENEIVGWAEMPKLDNAPSSTIIWHTDELPTTDEPGDSCRTLPVIVESDDHTLEVFVAVAIFDDSGFLNWQDTWAGYTFEPGAIWAWGEWPAAPEGIKDG